MRLTPSDVYGHYRPSKCDLRVFLKAHGTISAPPSPYEKVLRILGLRHEQKHLATLEEVVDLSTIQDPAELVERTKAAVAAILPQYTFKSRNSRTTKARRILREGLAEEALELISHAERIDDETANHARELLRKLRQSRNPGKVLIQTPRIWLTP